MSNFLMTVLPIMTPSRLFTTPLPTMSVTSPILSPTITPGDEDEEDELFDFQLSIVAVIIISGVAVIVLLLCICIIWICVKTRK